MSVMPEVTMSKNAVSLTLMLLLLLSASIILSACSEEDDPDTGTSLEMLLIPAGTFTMGDATGANETNERPARQVSINAMYVSKTEVPQGLYQQMMGANPSHNQGDKKPVEMVVWNEALEFCNALSKHDGFTEVYTDIGGNLQANFTANGYRLPTEAEWEYCCRAGTSTTYYTGASTTDLDIAGWYSGNASGSTHDVAALAANTFGLYDTHGNVFEWCWDWYAADYYQQGHTNNPKGPNSGQERVCRGGSYFVFEYGCRSSFRSMLAPDLKSRDIGIRIVRNAN
jgi:sulfatase modifying factor 1